MAGDLRRILYVEDDTDVQQIARVSLEMVGGFDVHICSSGNEALTYLAGELPDLILLDVMMPDLDGPATLAAIRADDRLAQIPVAFVTAKVQPGEVQQYLSLGALDVIAKPFDPMDLPSRVQEIWRRATA
jgi:CheY-like chemotaxis protein